MCHKKVLTHTALPGCLRGFKVVSHGSGAYMYVEHKYFIGMMLEEESTVSGGEGHTNYQHVGLSKNLDILPSCSGIF